MSKTLDITCPCGEHEYYLEYSYPKHCEMFCPFCGTEIEEENDQEDTEDQNEEE